MPASDRGRSASPAAEHPPHLALRGLVAGYGGVPVLHGVDVALPTGVFAVILGANGAGKTTTLRSVMGLAQVMSGAVELDGRSIRGWTSAAVVAAGVALVPEGRQLFSGLTVEENLLAGSLAGRRRSVRADRIDRVFTYFPVLQERRRQVAGTLSGGEQQMLAIGRALMSGPSLLLVDEASLGLAPIMVETLLELLSRINRDGVTVLAVEQNLAVIDHADFVMVLDNGSVSFGGRVEEIAERLDREVAATYLGSAE